jgi:crotonobetainyl-CoA:carnitine CoA-transferase CaiB-like acyl-CoA transferase
VAPQRMPLKSGVSSADILGSEMSLLGILAALEFRDRTGRGQFIDISMQDVSAWSTQTAWNGGISRRVAPHATLHVAGGYVLALGDEDVARAALGTEATTLTREAAVARLRQAGVACAPVLDVKEAVFLPHTRERKLWFTLEENGETWPVMANPLRLLGTPPRIAKLAPPLNADGPAILASIGLQPQESAA